MIRVTVELISAVSPDRNRVLGTMEIANDGSGYATVGNYNATLHAEYTPEAGRKTRVLGFNRQRQSVWSLIGAALKAMGHTKHVSKCAGERRTQGSLLP